MRKDEDQFQQQLGISIFFFKTLVNFCFYFLSKDFVSSQGTLSIDCVIKE